MSVLSALGKGLEEVVEEMLVEQAGESALQVDVHAAALSELILETSGYTAVSHVFAIFVGLACPQQNPKNEPLLFYTVATYVHNRPTYPIFSASFFLSELCRASQPLLPLLRARALHSSPKLQAGQLFRYHSLHETA